MSAARPPRHGTVRLDSVCRIIQGGRHKLSGKHFVEDGGYPAYGAGGHNGNLPSYEFDEPGIVLSAIGARCGKCFQPNGRWSSLANTSVFFPDEARADVRFLWYQLNNESSWHRSGTAQPYIKPSDVKSRNIYLPPLAEQKRIAGILEAADALRAQRRKALAELDTLFRSVFLDMFGDPVTNPKGWEVRALTETQTSVQTGPFGSLLHQEDYVTGGVPVVNPMHIVGGQIHPKQDQTVSAEKAAGLSGYRLKSGDVIMGRRGEMGRCAVVSDDEEGMLCGTGSLFLRPKPTELLPTFLATTLSSSSMKRHLESLSQGVTMPNLNSKMIESLRVPLPPLDRQAHFVAVVGASEQQKTSQRAHLAELDTLFASLQARAFRGDF